MPKEEQNLFNFRKSKKIEGGKTKRAQHVKLVVDETPEDFGYMGLTHSPKRGNHNNIPLKTNPQRGKTDNAYIRDELRYDDKKSFGDILKDYNLTEEDKAVILKYLERHKKKK